MMAVYGFCTSGMRKGAFVPVNFRFENFRPRRAHHKIPIFPRVLWWARQGLNLRPHPCEGQGMALIRPTQTFFALLKHNISNVLDVWPLPDIDCHGIK